jgi:hypothetical protein
MVMSLLLFALGFAHQVERWVTPADALLIHVSGCLLGGALESGRFRYRAACFVVIDLVSHVTSPFLGLFWVGLGCLWALHRRVAHFAYLLVSPAGRAVSAATKQVAFGHEPLCHMVIDCPSHKGNLSRTVRF